MAVRKRLTPILTPLQSLMLTVGPNGDAPFALLVTGLPPVMACSSSPSGPDPSKSPPHAACCNARVNATMGNLLLLTLLVSFLPKPSARLRQASVADNTCNHNE